MMIGVLIALILVTGMLWRYAATVRRWERDTALFNAWSGCHMTVEEYRAWRDRG
jgi:hypothetical protein